VTTSTISQAAQKIGPLEWTEADPVSLAFRVNRDWSGEYECQVRKTRKPDADLICSLDVTATWDPDAGLAGETTFTLTMSEDDSAPVKKGKYYADIQEVNGVTRVWAQVNVGPQVTVLV
jgi:hypothetical protein